MVMTDNLQGLDPAKPQPVVGKNTGNGKTTERVRKVKPTLDSVVFSTPVQKLLKFLLSESTTDFTPRVLSSRLKGVRGLGGAEGIHRVLAQLEELGMVQFLNNRRSVCLQNESTAIQMLKVVNAICDLEGIKGLVEPLSTKGILFGSRAKGLDRSDSDYDLFVVSDQKEEVERVVNQHPLGKRIELIVWNEDDYSLIEKRDRTLAKKLALGIVMWGPTW